MRKLLFCVSLLFTLAFAWPAAADQFTGFDNALVSHQMVEFDWRVEPDSLAVAYGDALSPDGFVLTVFDVDKSCCDLIVSDASIDRGRSYFNDDLVSVEYGRDLGCRAVASVDRLRYRLE